MSHLSFFIFSFEIRDRLFRVCSCYFVDRLDGMVMKNDPRDHTNVHEQEFNLLLVALRTKHHPSLRKNSKSIAPKFTSKLNVKFDALCGLSNNGNKGMNADL